MAPFDQEVYMEGFIGAYSLENWWTHDLSDHERKIIESTYKPIGLPEGSDNLGTQNNRICKQLYKRNNKYH
jgi:hypothetical protein